MSLITWTKEQFGTTVSKHDQEHQQLFDLLNNLHDAAGAGNRATTGAALDALITCVVNHFASEESNMKAIDYAGFAAHKEAHDKLVATCADLQKKFHAGQAEITTDTTQFVKDWLCGHIPTVDFLYGPPMNTHGMG
jgi:hemerythrin